MNYLKSRNEKFLNAIITNNISDLPAPISRIEIFLNAIATNNTENLPIPVSRIEKILDSIVRGANNPVEIPLSRFEKYLCEIKGSVNKKYTELDLTKIVKGQPFELEHDIIDIKKQTIFIDITKTDTVLVSDELNPNNYKYCVGFKNGNIVYINDFQYSVTADRVTIKNSEQFLFYTKSTDSFTIKSKANYGLSHSDIKNTNHKDFYDLCKSYNIDIELIEFEKAKNVLIISEKDAEITDINTVSLDLKGNELSHTFSFNEDIAKGQNVIEHDIKLAFNQNGLYINGLKCSVDDEAKYKQILENMKQSQILKIGTNDDNVADNINYNSIRIYHNLMTEENMIELTFNAKEVDI